MSNWDDCYCFIDIGEPILEIVNNYLNSLKEDNIKKAIESINNFIEIELLNKIKNFKIISELYVIEHKVSFFENYMTCYWDNNLDGQLTISKDISGNIILINLYFVTY